MAGAPRPALIRWRHAEDTEPHPAQPDPALMDEVAGQALTECETCRQVLILTDR